MVPQHRTSIVSRTLMTPGCRNVRDFRTAFRARGRRDLLVAMSKVKMLHEEPSSCIAQRPDHRISFVSCAGAEIVI